jgi:hypothetical protein
MAKHRARIFKVKSQKPLSFVIPAPDQVRDKLRRESRQFSEDWMPACAGMTGKHTRSKQVNEGRGAAILYP